MENKTKKQRLFVYGNSLVKINCVLIFYGIIPYIIVSLLYVTKLKFDVLLFNKLVEIMKDIYY
jgi:hypothetical protein